MTGESGSAPGVNADIEVVTKLSKRGGGISLELSGNYNNIFKDERFFFETQLGLNFRCLNSLFFHMTNYILRHFLHSLPTQANKFTSSPTILQKRSTRYLRALSERIPHLR